MIPVDKQIRGWAIDAALRTPRAETPSPAQLIKDAKVYEQYFHGHKPAKVLKLVKKQGKKK